MSQGEFLVDLEWRAGTPLEQTAIQVAAIDRQVRGLEGIASVFALVGSSAQAGGTAADKKEHTAHLLVRLAPEVSEEAAIEAVRDLLGDIPELKYKFSRPTYFSFRTPVEVEIRGYSLSTLDLLADEAVERMHTIPGLTDIRSSTAGGQPEVQIFFDRRRVAELGTTVQNIGELLRNKLQGDVATELARRDRKVDIRVRSLDEERQTVADLKQMIVSPASYAVPVALESVAEVRAVDGPAEIRRLDQERVAVISANLDWTRSRRRSRGDRNNPRRLAPTRGLHRVDRRPERGNGPLLRQHEIRPALGRILGLFGDGLAI